MRSIGVFVAFIFLGICFERCVGQITPIGQCTKIDSCSCVYDDGTIVNLSPLENTDGQPYFYNASDSTNDLYSWNPCSPFSYTANGSECINVAVCMIRQGLPFTLFYDLGSQDSANFMVDENATLKLTYTADKGEFKSLKSYRRFNGHMERVHMEALGVTEISLQCQPKSIFEFFVVIGEQEENNNTIKYKLTLASKHACALAPKLNPSSEVSELSGGTIFIIVLFSLIGAYIVFGVMYQAIVNKERGKKLCPNHEFWFNLPSLITGGCKKATSPLQSSDKGPKYDSI